MLEKGEYTKVENREQLEKVLSCMGKEVKDLSKFSIERLLKTSYPLYVEADASYSVFVWEHADDVYPSKYVGYDKAIEENVIVEIDIESPEGMEIDEEKSSFRKIVFKNKEPKYPTSISETKIMSSYAGIAVYTMPEIEELKAFNRVVQLCRAWNRIDGFDPDWEDLDEEKSVIVFIKGEVVIRDSLILSRPLHFKTKETAELFLETFSEDLELCKNLI